MTGKELLDAGKLSVAIEQIGEEVKSHPSDVARRTFLFELLCFAGDYDRAERQLDVLAHQSSQMEVGVQAYRNAIAAEKARARLWSDGARPGFLFAEPDYARLHLEAVNRLRENRPAEAGALLEESEDARPGIRGRLEETTSFADFRDGDDLVAPFLEVIVGPRYVWLPLEQVKSLEMPAPKRLRDLLWIPATVHCHTAPLGDVFLPVLYARSSEEPDERIKLGRMTDWRTLSDGAARGVGQRLFSVDGVERPMLEMRKVEFEGGSAGTG